MFVCFIWFIKFDIRAVDPQYCGLQNHNQNQNQTRTRTSLFNGPRLGLFAMFDASVLNILKLTERINDNHRAAA